MYDKDRNNQLDQRELEPGLRKYGVMLDATEVAHLGFILFMGSCLSAWVVVPDLITPA